MALSLLLIPEARRLPGKGPGRAPDASPETEAFRREHPDWWGQIAEDKRQVVPLDSSASPEKPEAAFVANAKGFRAFFGEHGVEVAPESTDWRWKFSLESVGGRPVPSVLPSAEGRRVLYRRGDVTEVYENRADGLEQSFEVTRPPEGGGPLVLEGRVEAPQGQQRGALALGFGVGQEEALRYDGLEVRDADGRQLRASLEWKASQPGFGRIRIVVEEDGRYPLAIDPLISAPAWQILGASQANAWFGRSVSALAALAVLGRRRRPGPGRPRAEPLIYWRLTNRAGRMRWVFRLPGALGERPPGRYPSPRAPNRLPHPARYAARLIRRAMVSRFWIAQSRRRSKVFLRVPR